MMTAYLTALTIGGGLLLLSIFWGGDADHDVDLDVDGDVDLHGDMDGHGVDHDLDLMDLWLPIASLRFWTFFAAFFGLTGSALTIATGLSSPMTLGVSLGVGYLTGMVATRLLRRLASKSVGIVLGSSDLVGTTGSVRLPIAADAPGKISMQIGGRTIDMIAESDAPVAVGADVMVIRVKDEGTVVVASTASLDRPSD